MGQDKENIWIKYIQGNLKIMKDKVLEKYKKMEKQFKKAYGKTINLWVRLKLLEINKRFKISKITYRTKEENKKTNKIFKTSNPKRQIKNNIKINFEDKIVVVKI